MSAQAKRLFVGGLNSGTKEQDIRERFKTFGAVSSVEVHVRPKSQGFPEKTFAYVNIEASDLDIQRCITMLSNTKWKGGILKIQMAKESFLSRLQKEREEIKLKEDRKKSKVSSLPTELARAAPNALPGTLIPGQKNWVVGKFGRVLPIVHMRQTGSPKICQIDPSKTVHNLKRIKDDCDEKPVSALTWSLEKENDNKVQINGNIQDHDSTANDDCDSTSSDEVGAKTNSASASKKKKKKSRRKETDGKDESEEVEIFEEKSNKKDSSLKNYVTEKHTDNEYGLENPVVKEDSSRLDDNDNVQNTGSTDENVASLPQATSNKKKNKKKRKASNSSDSDHGSSYDRSGKKKIKVNKKGEENPPENKENKSMLLDGKTDLKNEQNDSENHSIVRDLETTLGENIDEKKKEKKKARKREKEPKDGIVSENEIHSNELQVNKKKKREKKSQRGFEEAKTGEANDEESNDKRKKKSVKINEENKAKKQASNEKRLRAAEEREASSLSKQSVIASALNNLDGSDGKVKNPKHIMFDEEYEEEGEQMVEEKGKKTEAKISGSKASNWLGLDSASDDDDDDDDIDEKEAEDHLFAVKPQFEGEAGHKLFKLQKSYRGDSRFQLDERFAESDDESEEQDDNDAIKPSGVYSSDSEVETGAIDDDDISKQLSREKDMSMSVLRGILGHNIGTKHRDSTSNKHRITDSSLIRYDPTRDDHAQFEQKPKKQHDRPEPTAIESQQKDTDVMRSAPEVTREKFYDVKANVLTEMFGKNKTDETTTSFTFLSERDVVEDTETGGSNWGVTEELRAKPWNPVMLPYDSSGDEEDDMEHEEEQEHVQTAAEERFFFHFGDPELERRVDVEESLFTRTQTLDQLNEHWIATRSDLTQDYKKKHKDAMKRQSKMAAKRARMR